MEEDPAPALVPVLPAPPLLINHEFDDPHIREVFDGLVLVALLLLILLLTMLVLLPPPPEAVTAAAEEDGGVSGDGPIALLGDGVVMAMVMGVEGVVPPKPDEDCRWLLEADLSNPPPRDCNVYQSFGDFGSK